MRKKPSLPPRPLPPLSFQALDEVRDVEEAIQTSFGIAMIISKEYDRLYTQVSQKNSMC